MSPLARTRDYHQPIEYQPPMECFSRVEEAMTEILPHHQEPLTTTTPNRPRRRVRFAPQNDVIATVTANYHCWYLGSEIRRFRKESEALCEKVSMNRIKQFRAKGNSNNSDEKDFSCYDNEEDNSSFCLRGLELLLSQERQRNQSLANRTILAAQHNFRHKADQLANAARRCTAWAREIARNTAVVDYHQVYHPEKSTYMQPALPTALSPLAFLKKRLQDKEGVPEATRMPIQAK